MADLLENPTTETLSGLLGHYRVQYQVPIYQRDYAWGEDQIDDFVADVFGLLKSENEHFFGTIVLSDEAPGSTYDGPDKVRFLIDGQQRLITALLFLAAIRHQLNELAAQLSDTAQRQALELAAGLLNLTASGGGRAKRAKLHANRMNQQLLSPLLDGSIHDGSTARNLASSLLPDVRVRSEHLKRSYERLRKQIASRIAGVPLDQVGDGSLVDLALDGSTGLDLGRAVEDLSDVAERIQDQTLFVVITVRQWNDAFSVFEGLNNRGLELSEQDLVKNSLLSRAHGAHVVSEQLTEMERRWDRLTGRVASSRFPRFLRHYLLLHEADVPLKRVVRLITSHFSGSTADEMLREMERAADAYGRLTRPSREPDPKISEALVRLNALDAERAFPIILAALLTEVGREPLVRLIRQVEVLYFRRSAIMNRDNKVLEDDFQKIAAALYDRGEDGVHTALAAISTITPTDDEFASSFLTRHGMKASVARYMLVEMERYLSRGETKQVEHGKVTLEHILPQNPREWDLTDDQREHHPVEHTMIGNLTLLRGEANSSLSNKPFNEKLLWYKRDGNLKINESVINRTVWDEDAIKSRQYELLDVALPVWAR